MLLRTMSQQKILNNLTICVKFWNTKKGRYGIGEEWEMFMEQLKELE